MATVDWYKRNMPMAYFLYRAGLESDKTISHLLSTDFGMALTPDQQDAIAKRDMERVTHYLVKECMYQDPAMAAAANGLTFTIGS